MGPEWEILPPRKFEFASLQGSTQEKIEIQFQRRLLDSGWIMSLETNDKVQTVNKLACDSVATTEGNDSQWSD